VKECIAGKTCNSFKQAIQPYLKDVRGLHMSQRRLPASILRWDTNEVITPVDPVSYNERCMKSANDFLVEKKRTGGYTSFSKNLNIYLHART